jgi:hypothetical protein
MISRISSFSGPRSILFKVSNVAGFTTDGLILRYYIGSTTSYSGSNTVTDLRANSNGALTNGPTFSSNGYLNFDGTDDYLVTNTSLRTVLTPSSTSTIISYFLWIYPQENGVIVAELGSTSLETAWHDAQIEMVSGTLKFSVWPYSIGSPRISSSISTPFNNWYYVGITYDGTTLKAYVNNSLAGSALLTREAPSTGLFYSIAARDTITNLGDGTYAKLKLGDFHVYNTALTAQQIGNNYNATKGDYVYTANNTLFYIDANDPQSYSGAGSNILDLSGNGVIHTMTNATYKSIYGVRCFDCTGTNNVIRSSAGLTLSTSGYTYVSWARVLSSTAGFRTLYRAAPNDHPLLINIGTNTLGFYDNDTSLFYSSGYDITNIVEKWVQWSVVGDSSGSTFYINGDLVGTASKSAAGNKHDYISLDGQSFGYVANTILYNAKLTQDQIKQNYDALKSVYETSNFVTANLKLAFSPNNGDGSSWYDIKGTNNATLTGSPTYNSTGYTFNGTSQYGRIPSSTGITDFTNADTYTVEIWIKPSSGQPHAVTTVLEKWNLGNTPRYPYTLRFNEGMSNAYFACYDGTNFIQGSLTDITVDNWCQLVGVFNFTTDVLTVYKNGSLGVTASLVGVGQVSNSSPVGIAHRVSTDGLSAEFMFKGSVGIVRMYSSALSASDVLTNFNANRSIYGI